MIDVADAATTAAWASLRPRGLSMIILYAASFALIMALIIAAHYAVTATLIRLTDLIFRKRQRVAAFGRNALARIKSAAGRYRERSGRAGVSGWMEQ